MSALAFRPLAHEEPEWHGLPDHLSYSALTQYHRCREQFRQRYIAGLKMPPKGYLVWGSADSRAAEHNYRQKIDSHEDVTTDEVREVFAQAVDDLIDEFGGASQIDWEDGDPAQVKDAGVRLAAVYHEQAAPQVQPVAVERRFELRVDGVPVPIIGFPDVETEVALVERKTTGKKWTKPSGDYLAQARIYQLHEPTKQVEWHVSTKTKTPAVYTPREEAGLVVQPAGSERTERWIRSTTAAISADMETFGPEGPWPGSHAQAMSPCSWCGFASVCAWQR